MVKDTEYLKRYKQLFARYVDLESGDMIDLTFKYKVQILRQDNSPDNHNKSVYHLINDFGFPNNMREFVRNYIVNSEIDFNLIGANLFLVSPGQLEAITGREESLHSGMLRYTQYSIRYNKAHLSDDDSSLANLRVPKELKLVIGKNVSIEQIVDFIRTNKNYIKSFQSRLQDDGNIPTRIRPRINLRRDMRVLELKEKGMKHKEIAAQINRDFSEAVIAYGDIPTILRNLKNK
jgi:hypothetical protein